MVNILMYICRQAVITQNKVKLFRLNLLIFIYTHINMEHLLQKIVLNDI